jgi:hypothetical protein
MEKEPVIQSEPLLVDGRVLWWLDYPWERLMARAIQMDLKYQSGD